MEGRFEAKLKELSDQFTESSKEIHIWASKVSIAIPHYTAQYNAFLDKRGAMSKDELNDAAKWLRARAQEVGDFAEQLQDKRTVSWVQSQHALLHYFEGQFVEALGWQVKACSFVAPDVKFDRERNLACIAGMVFKTTRDREALKLKGLSITRSAAPQAHRTHCDS